MPELVLTARWIVPVSSPPIEGGRLVIEGGRIARFEKGAKTPRADVDYGDAMVLPGFINAHTHLELTGFSGCAPYMGSFTDWLRVVVSLQTAAGAEEKMRDAVTQGLRQSLAAGVTTVVDTGCGPRVMEDWRRSPINVTGLCEVLGMGPRARDQHPRSLGSAIALLEGFAGRHGGDNAVGDMRGGEPRGSFSSGISPQSSGISPQSSSGTLPHVSFGISPHAPYSTAPEVYRAANTYARDRNLLLSTHLSETREEIEFLVRGTGPFRKLLEERGLWDGSFTPPGCSPAAYADALGVLDGRCLLAHVNCASEADIDLLARRSCSVVFCPRTHRFFQHEPHPYRRMLERGVNVCVGTDSLASAPTLSILDELRFLRNADATCSSRTLLEMGTLRGARAIGFEDRIGSLDPGKQADLVVVPLTSASASDPVDDLLGGTAAPCAAWVAGNPDFTYGKPGR